MSNLLIDKLVVASLSINIKKAYNNLVTQINDVPVVNLNNKVLDGTGGKVSVKDLIAYQIGWGKLLISWYQSGINNEEFVMPGDGFSSWDYTGLALQFYEKYHYESIEEQLNEFRKVVLKILEIVELEDKNNNLDAIGVWAWCTLKSGKQWPLSKWITINTLAPYKRALSIIKKCKMTAAMLK